MNEKIRIITNFSILVVQEIFVKSSYCLSAVSVTTQLLSLKNGCAQMCLYGRNAEEKIFFEKMKGQQKVHGNFAHGEIHKMERKNAEFKDGLRLDKFEEF